jgi:hypothetical protein
MFLVNDHNCIVHSHIIYIHDLYFALHQYTIESESQKSMILYLGKKPTVDLYLRGLIDIAYDHLTR